MTTDGAVSVTVVLVRSPAVSVFAWQLLIAYYSAELMSGEKEDRDKDFLQSVSTANRNCGKCEVSSWWVRDKGFRIVSAAFAAAQTCLAVENETHLSNVNKCIFPPSRSKHFSRNLELQKAFLPPSPPLPSPPRFRATYSPPLVRLRANSSRWEQCLF